MDCRCNAQMISPTLRDVAQAALAIDADGGHGPVSWSDVVEKAHDLAAKRLKGAPQRSGPGEGGRDGVSGQPAQNAAEAEGEHRG
jgi:hypothetical protein